jgi:hypothetical protein
MPICRRFALASLILAALCVLAVVNTSTQPGARQPLTCLVRARRMGISRTRQADLPVPDRIRLLRRRRPLLARSLLLRETLVLG